MPPRTICLFLSGNTIRSIPAIGGEGGNLSSGAACGILSAFVKRPDDNIKYLFYLIGKIG
ncbi:hypothetical protein DSCA_52930 [Desulfosarcina alkanivorans]|uniref:Uncharacterized protein n=1 Tax=Desulfosarcina alkanivorans TaxID=571177 RepID=A0A5K7YTI6_9BACT|nr:hypothetical protein [Desulfosarcina alkanivorans]BBO71363.1 hypothetical protein DSCA_52930 [Desulfosarcina alkanivorans]